MRLTGLPKNPPLNLHALIARNDDSDWMAIHRFHAKDTWERTRGTYARLSLLAKALAWPFITIFTARRMTKKFGKTIRKHSGKSQSRQRIEQFFLAFFQGVSPKSYYLFQLYEPANRRRAQQYIHRYETKNGATLYGTIAPDRRVGARLLNDKNDFFHCCVKNGLPTAQVHRVIDAGSGSDREDETPLPPVDLFIKPTKGRGGTGTQIWYYRQNGAYENTEGELLEGHALLDRLRDGLTDGSLLVQSRLENHSQLKELCGSVLSTARMMTVLDETLEPELTTAVFRMANGHAVVDNIHRGGLAAAVDLDTGTLGDALSLSYAAMRTDRHPKSGTKISGYRLPHWAEAIDLVIRAHKAMPGNAVVGWDVGFTERGPVLVEGNCGPCVHLLQRGMGAPLGGTRFAELIAFHLRRVQQTTEQAPVDVTSRPAKCA